MRWSVPCLPPSPQQVLRQALKNEDADLIWAFCNQHASVLDLNEKVHGRCALHLATMTQDIRLIKWLVKNRINVDAVDDNGQTSLFISCLSGRLEIVMILFDANANIHHPDLTGTTPFMVCCWRGHVDVARFLYENGASLADRNHLNETALSLSRMWSQMSSLDYLLTILMQELFYSISISPKIGEFESLQSKIESCFKRLKQEATVDSIYTFGADILLPLLQILCNGQEPSGVLTLDKLISRLDH